MGTSVAQDALALAQLAELSARLQSQTETVERLVAGITNHVLYAGTILIPAEGYFLLNFGATIGAVELWNPTANLATIVSGMPTDRVATNGPGVHRVNAGTFRSVNVGARFVTVYGTAGDLYGVHAWTTGTPAGATHGGRAS